MEKITSLADVYRAMGPVFKATRKLIQLVLTFPITSNEGERSFSLLKRLLHYSRVRMTESRLNYLAIMSLHPNRLGILSTESIIDQFLSEGSRRLRLNRLDVNYQDSDSGNNCLILFVKQILFFWLLLHIFTNNFTIRQKKLVSTDSEILKYVTFTRNLIFKYVYL